LTLVIYMVLFIPLGYIFYIISYKLKTFHF